MPVTKATPYLIFNGDGAAAVQLYERALGAKVVHLSRFREAPGADPASPDRDRVLHAELKIGDGLLMISDAPPDKRVPAESNVQVCLEFGDVDELRRRFDALAVGGKIAMPVAEMFWNATFGMLVDVHGIGWMFNCPKKSEEGP